MKYLKLLLFVIPAILISFAAYKDYSYKKTIEELQNQIAQRDITTEVQKNLYEKIALRAKDLEKVVNLKDEQIKSLIKQADSKDEKIASLMSINATLLNQSGNVPSTQTTTTDNKVERKKVNFEGQVGSGLFSVNGYTITDPAETWLNIKQNRPIKLAISISQSDDDKWIGRVATSESDLKLDISQLAVNPKIAANKWYNNIHLYTFSTFTNDLQFSQSLNLSYDFSNFSVGPIAGFSVYQKSIFKFYGASFTWRVF
jgi:hypothetical protein